MADRYALSLRYFEQVIANLVSWMMNFRFLNIICLVDLILKHSSDTGNQRISCKDGISQRLELGAIGLSQQFG